MTRHGGFQILNGRRTESVTPYVDNISVIGKVHTEYERYSTKDSWMNT
jgi:hypothetical protein